MCTYFDLTGIIIDKDADSELVKSISDSDWKKFLQYHVGEDISGVVSLFLGVDSLLGYARIFDMDRGRTYMPKFKVENGKFVPSMSLCGEHSIRDRMPLSETMRVHSAMRELLTQSLNYLDGERKGRYFMITPYSKGCCSFGGGVIETNVSSMFKKTLSIV